MSDISVSGSIHDDSRQPVVIKKPFLGEPPFVKDILEMPDGCDYAGFIVSVS